MLLTHTAINQTFVHLALVHAGFLESYFPSPAHPQPSTLLQQPVSEQPARFVGPHWDQRAWRETFSCSSLAPGEPTCPYGWLRRCTGEEHWEGCPAKAVPHAYLLKQRFYSKCFYSWKYLELCTCGHIPMCKSVVCK